MAKSLTQSHSNVLWQVEKKHATHPGRIKKSVWRKEVEYEIILER